MTVVETLEPVVEKPVVLSLDYGADKPLIYAQQPLSFFGKMELFSVLSGAVQKALSKEGGVSLAGILDVPESRDGLTARDFLDANQFVAAIAALVEFAPDLLKDIYCISLRVPRQEREVVKELMEDQVTDEQGVKLLENFIDQNWEVMTSFFLEQVMPLVEKVSQKVQSSAPSKQSSPTPARTRKQSKSA